MKEAGDWRGSKSPKLSEFNYQNEGSNPKPQEDSRSQHLRNRLHLPSKQDIKKVIHPKKPLFGKDGPRGSWYVRIPLWMQTTILIFFIGFLSLLVLTLVSAIKVWSYTESLMKNRLSTLAGMTGIEIEQGFDSLERSVTYSTSTANAVDFLEAANNNQSMTGLWNSFNKEFGVEISLSDCLAMELYDKNLELIFSYRKRTSSNRLPGQQNNMIPRELFPLSQPDLRDDMLANLNVIEGGVLANATANQVYASTRNVNLTYSVSQKISSEPQLNIFDGRIAPESGRADTVGYSTFVFKNQVTSSIVKERLFPQYIIEIVRLNDILLNNTYDKSTTSGTFSFLYPFVAENGTTSARQNWTITSFPVLTDAIELVLRSYNETLTSNQMPSNETASSNRPVDGSDGGGNTPDKPPALARRNEPIPRGVLRRSHNSTAYSRFNNTDSNTTSSTNSGQGDIPNQFNISASDNRTSLAKLDAAHMRTKTPFDDKSSVGYSYASVYDQKWLVFVEIPESEAFNDARHLRNVIIGVGAGILGAVLLILLPLSRWQTRGFYIIYQNMKLRPILILDESIDDKDPELNQSNSGTEVDNELEDESSSQDNKPEVRPLAGGDDSTPSRDLSPANSSIEVAPNNRSDETANSMKKKHVQMDSGSGEVIKHEYSTDTSAGTSPVISKDYENRDSINFEGSSVSYEKKRYRFNTPKPLPPLNRWFSDEVDDLIGEYNNMTEKLNAYYLHLEDQVRIRTHEAQKARELREEANAAKSEFIAIISHELRTPLNGIMGLTAVNADEEDVSNIQSALRVIIESGHVLMDLLNELLELSKSLVGVDPSVSEFTPIELLETLPNLFSPRTPVLTTRFALAAVPHTLGNLKLRGDLDHISHICLNFMSNAMKFSDQNGNVSVILHLRPLDDPLVNLEPYGNTLKNANAVLEILVTDSGVGISSAQLARIFDLFVQGEDPLRKNQKGAGLGMALSKQLAEGIGGYIAVFSAKGVGTTTVLHVPVEAIGLTAEEVLTFNGPPIEFKVRDVYSTISLRAGDVQLLQDQGTSNLGTRANATPNAQTDHPTRKHSRHAHQSSNGSRLLLNRAHPVSKLLRSQSQHQHNHSEYSNKSHGSQGSGRTAATSDANSLKGAAGSAPNSALPAVVGVHGNHSASSLLMNIPDGMFDDERDNVRSSVISNGTEFFEVSQTTSGRNSPTPGSTVSGPKTGLAKYGATVQRRNSTMLKIIPPALSLARDSSISATSRSPALLPDSTPNTATSESTTMMLGSSPERSASPAPGISSEAKVLLAEDNKLNQEIMVKMLQHLGISHVDTAGDGATVIKLVEQSIVDGFHYSIIFMDLSMPGMDGLDATQFIRGTLGYPYPIVALTGFSDIETRNACMAVSIQEVLTKPVMKFDIMRVLQKYTT